MARVCLDCPAVVQSGSRCTSCARVRDRRRGTRQERGYDAAHDAERARWAPLVAAGQVACRRAATGSCAAPQALIDPDEPWDLGHPDRDCPAPRAPEHRACNRATAGR